MNVHDQIAVLEKQLAELKKQVGRPGRDDPLPSVKAFEEPGVRIVELISETAAMPNLGEMKRLFGVVRPLAPGKLDDKYDEDRPFRGFCAAFRWVQNQNRIETPNPRLALTYWLDDCRAWLRQRNCVANDVDGNAFVLAIYAAGDVCYVPHDLSRGQLWEFGLHEHYGRGPQSFRRVAPGDGDRKYSAAIAASAGRARRRAQFDFTDLVRFWSVAG